MKERLRFYTNRFFRKVFPESVPPRLCLFFIILAVQSIAVVIAGVFLGVDGAHNAGVALCSLALYIVTFVLIFIMALPHADGKLLKHGRHLRISAKCIVVFLLIGAVVEAIVVSPCFVNGNALLFNKWENPFVPNDRIVLGEQASQALIDGENPYTHINIIRAAQEVPALNPTILRQGAFANVYTRPSEERVHEVLAKALETPDVIPVEFESKISYPAGSFLFHTPFVALDIDIRWFYLICALILMGYVVWRAPSALRPLIVIGSIASVLVWNAVIAGSMDSLYLLFILLGWTLRKRIWLAAACMGLAVTCKQTAITFVFFYLILLLRESGWRNVFKSVAMIGAVFALTNLPFVVADPQSWISGLLAPINDPFIPEGVGIVSFATLATSPVPSWLFALIEGLVLVAALVWYYRNCRKAPQTGLLLAIVPFFFAWRSLASYFAMIPLLVFAAVVIEEYSNGSRSTT